MAQTEIENSFDQLRSYKGKPVKVDYFQFGLPYSEELTLKDINDYINLTVGFPGGKTIINFVGYKSVIRQISDENGKILYKNENILEGEDFKKKTRRDLENLFQSTFGFKGLSSLEPTVSNQSNSSSSRDNKPWYSRLENWPRKEFFR